MKEKWIRPQLAADMHKGKDVPVASPVPSKVIRPQLQEDIGGEYVQPRSTTAPFPVREMD